MTTPTADRYVLAGLGEKVIAFPDYYVLDVLVVDRNYVMRLPFYSPCVIGVTQHLGKIVPLLSLRHLFLPEQNVLLPGQLPVVRLAKSLPELFGAGLIVDRIMGSRSREQYEELKNTYDLIPINVVLDQLGGSHWLPQRWYALNP
jgi:chemotaxis signal transduction protein